MQIYITKCFFEVLLAFQKGLTYTARSSRLQDTSLLQGSLPASLHPNTTVRRSQTLVSDFVLLHLLRNVQFSPDSVFASSQTYLSLLSFTSFAFPQKLAKVTLQTMREGKRRDVKNRREGQMRTSRSWERKCRQSRESIFLIRTLTAQLILCKSLLFKIMSTLLQFSTLNTASLTALSQLTK